jgi:chromosome segregation ATPase
MVNPIRKAIDEEVDIFFKKCSIKGVYISHKENLVDEFKDALEHNLNKQYKGITQEEREHVYRNTELKMEREYKSKIESLEQQVREKEKFMQDLTDRNGRLHSDIKKRQKWEVKYTKRIEEVKQENERLKERLKAFEEKVYQPLVVYKDPKLKVDFFKDPLIKHLEEEVAFLRTLVTKFSE